MGAASFTEIMKPYSASFAEIGFEHQFEFMAFDKAGEIDQFPFHGIHDVVVEGFFDCIDNSLPEGFLQFGFSVQLQESVQEVIAQHSIILS